MPVPNVSPVQLVPIILTLVDQTKGIVLKSNSSQDTQLPGAGRAESGIILLAMDLKSLMVYLGV